MGTRFSGTMQNIAFHYFTMQVYIFKKKYLKIDKNYSIIYHEYKFLT
jgi:hypothetical protein